MELQVQELLKKIKDDGIEAARKEAQAIMEEAGSKAEALVAQAERRSAEIEAAAKARIEGMEKASRLALIHASRDSLLGLKEKVGLFAKDLVRSAVKEAFDAEFLKSFLPSVLVELAKGTDSDLDVLVSPRQLLDFDAAFAGRLAKDLSVGVTFKPFAAIDAGFRIAVEGGTAHYDFSAEAISAILAARVNATLAECVAAAMAKE